MRERTPEEERLRRRQRLAAALRLFAAYGFDEGAAGHLTARDPILDDHFWVNPFGVHFGRIRCSDLLLVDHTGRVVEGERKINPAAFAIHSRIHLARPDVVAAAHSHSLHGRAWSALGRPLDPISQDACAFFEDHVVFDDYAGVVLDTAEGDRIARALGGGKAAILRNHGLLTVGHTVEEAAWWFMSMDGCCHAQLLVEAAGAPVLIDPERARETRAQIGSHDLARLNFRPLYDHIVHEQPDLLD
ncbi:class II aldolase/adducin family protein [Amycolatopsis sp. NPDC004079]|uniref:class II aldolase/adducin family protein n=1 Tax=Amycolatopsis sp. NPDC004079 TaxID=3154549 RepID=UPI00339E056C